MATKIIADPSNGTQGTLPTNAGSIIRGPNWGISNTLSGFIVLSESITREVITDLTFDQKGSLVSELDYDEHYTLNLNVIGSTGGAGDLTQDSALPEVGDTTFAYAGHKWKVKSVQYTGSYQDKQSFSIQCERYHNFPSQS